MCLWTVLISLYCLNAWVNFVTDQGFIYKRDIQGHSLHPLHKFKTVVVIKMPQNASETIWECLKSEVECHKYLKMHQKMYESLKSKVFWNSNSLSECTRNHLRESKTFQNVPCSYKSLKKSFSSCHAYSAHLNVYTIAPPPHTNKTVFCPFLGLPHLHM